MPDPTGGAVGGTRVAAVVGVVGSGEASVAVEAESRVGVDSADCVFCASTVIATEVAIMELFDAEGPQALNVRVRMASKAVKI